MRFLRYASIGLFCTKPKWGAAALVIQAMLLAGCIGVSSAAGDKIDAAELVDRSLKASGLQNQLEVLPEAFLSWLPADAFPGGKPKKEILEYVKKSTEGTALSSVRSELMGNLDQEKITEVLAFYETRLGQKVARLQGSALSPSLIRIIREGRKATVSQDEGRLELLRRLVRAEGLPAAATELSDSAVRGICDGAASGNNSSEAASKADAVISESKHRSGERGTEESALIAFSSTFSSLSDRELQEFTQFSESQASEWFRNTVRRGLKQSIYLTGRALGEVLTGGPAKTR